MTIPEAVAILGTVRYQFFNDVDVSCLVTRDELIIAYDEWELCSLP